MNLKNLSLAFALCCFAGSAAGAYADAPKVEFPAPSPACTIKQRVGLTDVEIEYSRPSVKGREIFGGMIAYGKVWRTGANKATKITFSTAVKLNGTEIPAGTYALMTIPGKDEWTVIINKGSDQWGAYKYDEKGDLARIKAKPVNLSQAVESFTIDFDNLRDESAEMDLSWDKTRVPVKIEVDVTEKVLSQIKEVMASDAKQKPYYQAAMFYYNHGQDLKQAKEWVDKAIAEREAHYMVYLKAEILAKLGDKEGAIAAAKQSSELAEKASDPSFVKLNADLIKSLKK